MLHSLDGQAELIWASKAGKPARSIDDYHPLEVMALLTCGDEVREEAAIMSARPSPRRAWWAREDAGTGPRAPARRGRLRGPPGGPVKAWDVPRYTGDPVTDAWEREIAEGRDPDLER